MAPFDFRIVRRSENMDINLGKGFLEQAFKGDLLPDGRQDKKLRTGLPICSGLVSDEKSAQSTERPQTPKKNILTSRCVQEMRQVAVERKMSHFPRKKSQRISLPIWGWSGLDEEVQQTASMGG